MDSAQTTPVIEFQDISKSFGAIHALAGVSFSINRGEVHAIVGENGAGKTTLMNLLGGRLQPDRGQIVLRGSIERISSPQHALHLGISVVHQEITLCPNLSIAEKVMFAATGVDRRTEQVGTASG